MSSLTVNTNLKGSEALKIASELSDVIRPFCEKIQIVGSVRRQRMFVKDIELLVIPKMVQDPASLFDGELVPALHPNLDGLLLEGVVAKDEDHNAWGERYRRFIFQGAKIDLFICMPPAQFGVLEFIRTGPVDWTKPRITKATEGGLLPMGMYVQEGQLFDRKQLIETPTEHAFFAACNYPYVPPQDRIA